MVRDAVWSERVSPVFPEDFPVTGVFSDPAGTESKYQ